MGLRELKAAKSFLALFIVSLKLIKEPATKNGKRPRPPEPTEKVTDAPGEMQLCPGLTVRPALQKVRLAAGGPQDPGGM